MFDFAADHRDEGDRPGINDKGLITHDRRVKKDAFFFYQASWTDSPVLHITSRRYNPRPTGPATVKVYSNAETVNLSLNGRPLGPGTRDGVIHLWDPIELPPGPAQLEATARMDGEAYSDRITWEVVDLLPTPFTNASPVSE